MAVKLRDLKAGVVLRGLVSSGSATVVGVENIVPGTVNLTYRLPSGRNDSQLVWDLYTLVRIRRSSMHPFHGS